MNFFKYVESTSVTEGEWFVVYERQDWCLNPKGWKLPGSDILYDLNSLEVTETDRIRNYDKVFYKEICLEGYDEERDIEYNQTLFVTYSLKYRDYLRRVREGQLDRARKLVNQGKAQVLLRQLRTLSKGENDLIFPTATGLYLSTTKVNEALKRISSKLGIKYMSSHKIRFWAITALCRETGGDITAVGAYAGQACRQTTLHYIRRAQNEAVQKTAARKVFG